MYNFLFLSLILIGVLISEISYSQTPEENSGIPSKIWETTIRDPNLEYELKGSGITDDGSQICLVLGSRQKGESAGPQSLKLQIVDPVGELRASIELNAHIQPSQDSRMHVGGVSVTASGVVFLALAQGQGQVRLVGVDIATSKSVINSILEFGYPNLDLYKMLLTQSGTLLLVGTSNEKSFIAEVDQSGKILWHKIIDEQINRPLDATRLIDGFAVVGGKRVKNAFKSTFAEIWLGEISLEGDLIQSYTLPSSGRSASIAQSSNKSYAVIYDEPDDRPESKMVKVVVQGLSSDLHPTWNRILLSDMPITAPFRIASIRSGGYMVAGVKEKGRLWVSRLKEDGTAVWTHSTKAVPPDYPRFHSVDLLKSDEDFILVSGLSTVSGRTQQQIVSVVKFSIK